MALVGTEAIRDAVAFCVGEGITIYWDGEAETPMATVPYVVAPAGACRVRLSLSVAVQVGEDDVRMIHNLTSDMIETTYAGNRMATLSLRIEADAREEAYETAERVRTRLRFRTPHELLKAANISIAQIENNQGVDYSWDNRDISACVLDIRLNIGSNDRDEDITFIKTVNTTNTVPGTIIGLNTDVPVSLDSIALTYFPGDEFYLSGSGFRTGLAFNVNGVDYNTTFVNQSKLLVRAPNLAAGTYSAYLHLAGTQSNIVSLTLNSTLIDPAALNLTGWFEQGMGRDYNAGAGTWTSLASAGPSDSRVLNPFGSAPWLSPTVGAALDGVNSVRFGTDLRDLRAALANPSFFAVSSFTIAGLIKLDPSVGPSNPTGGGQAIMAGTYLNVFGGQVGGLGRLNLHTVSSIDNYALSPTFPLGQWVSFFARQSGGTLSIRLNKVQGALTTGVANVNAAFIGTLPRVAHPSNGCSIHDKLAILYTNVALSDSVCDQLHDRWKSRFPSAGLV